MQNQSMCFLTFCRRTIVYKSSLVCPLRILHYLHFCSFNVIPVSSWLPVTVTHKRNLHFKMAFKSFLLVASTVCSLGHTLHTSNLPWIIPRDFELRQVQPGSICGADQPITFAPHKNIWQGLTDSETASVTALLHHNSTGLNLTAAVNATR